jgi:hypothetical protein
MALYKKVPIPYFHDYLLIPNPFVSAESGYQAVSEITSLG